MKNWSKISLLILALSLVLTACTSEKTAAGGDAVSNEKGETQFDTGLPDYAFAIDGYVKIQEGKVDSIRVTDYLPDRSITVLYKDMTVENGLQYSYNLYPNTENVQYEGVSSLDIMANNGGDNNYTSTGYYYYDKEADCLAEVSDRTAAEIAYLIPMGKSLEVRDGTRIQNLPYLFTVTCEAGIFKDCVAVMETTDFSTADESREITTVTYYAKGIGEILTVSNFQNGGFDFLVTDILMKITDVNETGSQDTKNNISSSDVNYNWWENKCYVSTQTGGYFYGFRYSSDGEPYFTFGSCCVPISTGKVEIIEHDRFGTVLTYTFPTIMRRGNSIINDEYYVLYYIERDDVETANASGTYTDRFYYDASYQLKPKQSDDVYTDGDYTDYGRYHCAETDTIADAETQNGSLQLRFATETFMLYRNGADTGWEFINEEFEDRVYTSVMIDGSKMTIVSTEPWRYDGTYVQLPDFQ